MMNKNVKIGSLISLILALIVSVFANFYSPKIPANSIDLTVNVADSSYQPISIDKRFGVTKLINARFDLNCNGDTITNINLNSVTISGLLDFNFSNSIFINDTIYIFLTPFRKEEYFNVIIPDDGIVIDTDNPGEWRSELFYDINLPDSFSSLSYEEQVNQIEALSEEGRICNINCVHE